MKAITVKVSYRNGCKSRLLVTDGDTRIFVRWDYDCTYSQNTDFAVRKFCEVLHWTGTLVRGETKDSTVYVFQTNEDKVFIDPLT